MTSGTTYWYWWLTIKFPYATINRFRPNYVHVYARENFKLPQICRHRTIVRWVAISNVIIPFNINLRWISSLLLHFWVRSLK